MNTEWNKLNIMNEDERHKLIDFRLDTLERNYNNISAKIDKVELIVTRLDQKVPSGGLACDLHKDRVEALTKRADSVESENNHLKSEIGKLKRASTQVKTAVALISFVLASLIFPYAVSNFKIVKANAAAVMPVHASTNHIVKP